MDRITATIRTALLSAFLCLSCCSPEPGECSPAAPFRSPVPPPEPESGSLAVRVVDSAGRPVPGVPLAVYVIGKRTSWGVAHRFVSGRGGLARIPDTSFLAEALEEAVFSCGSTSAHAYPDWADRYCDDSGDFQLALTFAFPHRDPAALTFAPGCPPRDVVRVILPATRKVVVTVRDEQGEPLAGKHRLRLRDHQEGFGLDPGRLPHGIASLEEGQAVYPQVGLGLKLEASLETEILGRSLLPELRIRTPEDPGEPVESGMGLTGIRTLVTGVLLVPGHLPLAHTTIRVTLPRWLDARKQTLSHALVHTDGKGGFQFFLDEGLAAEAGGRMVFRLTADRGRSACNGPTTALATCPVPGPDCDRQVDLGDILLSYPPIVAAGRFLDSRGRPIPGARIVVERWLVDSGNRVEPGRPHWSLAQPLFTVTDRGGRFRIRDTLQVGRLRLLARCAKARPGCHSRRRVVSAGSRNITLRREPAGSLEGSLLFSPGTEPDSLKVLLVLPEALRDEGCPTPRYADRQWDEELLVYPHNPLRRAKIEADGSFRWRMVPPGSYAVWIGHEDDPGPMIRISAIRVEPHQDARDPRLARIDLRGRIRSFPLHFELPDRCRVRQVKIHRGPHDQEGRSVPARRATLTTGLESLDLTITGKGLRDQYVEKVTGERCIELEPGIPVTVTIRGAGKALHPSYGLGLFPVPETGGGRPAPGRVGANGTARLLLPHPGRYLLRLVVHDQDSRDMARWRLPANAWRSISPVIEVSGPGPRSFRVSLSGKAQEDLRSQVKECQYRWERNWAWRYGEE